MRRTVQQVMTQDPAFCTPETSLEDVAKLMVQYRVRRNSRHRKPCLTRADRCGDGPGYCVPLRRPWKESAGVRG